MIELSHVTKLYRTVIGVNDLNFDLGPGAYGLIGPNGSGKTTLINLLVGNLKPSIGNVRVAGKNPWRDRKVLSKIGLCPASDLLCPNVTAFQWIQYMLGLHGFSMADSKTRAVQSLKQVGMDEAMHREIGGYSLGMRQRTKLAQAISHDPDWLILDEPFNGLDPVGRFDLSELIKAWGKDGKGLILASHVLHEVEAVTQQFLLIHGGRILASGSADEVQSMLVDFPQEVELKGRGLPMLASAMASEPWVNSMRFENDRQSLVVAVGEARKLFDFLANSAHQDQFAITGIDSPNGNLAAAFDSLLRVHRGEV